MTLNELLEERGIKRALIVDDVCDSVPTANDIVSGNELWPIFNDDLQREQRDLIEASYPESRTKNFDELITNDIYVAKIWELREKLGEICNPIFETYIADQEADQQYIDQASARLQGLGLECITVGKNFQEAAQSADLILIDLFFSKTQDDSSLDQSKSKLRQALETRLETPPLVILMSRSHRLEEKRDEFRDEVGLLDSAFRIIKKSDLDNSDRLETQLERLAENALDSLKLSRFICSLQSCMEQATTRTLALFRKLRLSDIGQVQQLLLSAEGEPTGSYLVDLFDRVLQHEIERESNIIDSALNLNAFSYVNHPPPYIAGSPELQELVERTLTQNQQRLRLPGALEATISFGDIVMMTNEVEIERLKSILLVDTSPDAVMLVLTPACDLQRKDAPRILLLMGTRKRLGVHDWSYGGDARTPAIRIGTDLFWIKWDLKHIDTVSHAQVEEAFTNNDLNVVARLRETHALELQQKLLSGLGRVGMTATLPATFPVDLEVYTAGLDGIPVRLDIEALNDGAVCFVGRDNDSNPELRLVMTDYTCDGIIDAITNLDEKTIPEAAQKAFTYLRNTSDLRHILTNSIDLRGIGNNNWSLIKSLTGAEQGIPNMGLIAWNYTNIDEVLHRKFLNKAGIIILLKDRSDGEAPGLDEAVRNGLVQSEAERTD